MAAFPDDVECLFPHSAHTSLSRQDDPERSFLGDFHVTVTQPQIPCGILANGSSRTFSRLDSVGPFPSMEQHYMFPAVNAEHAAEILPEEFYPKDSFRFDAPFMEANANRNGTGSGIGSKNEAQSNAVSEEAFGKKCGEATAIISQGKQHSRKRSVDSNKSPAATDVASCKDFVVVRARRGQATDRHSIAERARREKIRKRMNYLQELVPGCCKAGAGKTVILDEIINYVKSLQNQVEFLSMKLSAATAGYDFGIGMAAESCSAGFPEIPFVMPATSSGDSFMAGSCSNHASDVFLDSETSMEYSDKITSQSQNVSLY